MEISERLTRVSPSATLAASEDPVAEAAESISGAIIAAMDGKRGELVALEDRRNK